MRGASSGQDSARDRAPVMRFSSGAVSGASCRGAPTEVRPAQVPKLTQAFEDKVAAAGAGDPNSPGVAGAGCASYGALPNNPPGFCASKVAEGLRAW